MKHAIFLLSLVLLYVHAQTPSQRAHDLVNAMSNPEKYSLLNGIGWNGWNQVDGYYIGNTPTIKAHNIPSINMQDGPQGFRTTSTSMYTQVTSWPCSLGVSSTWDADQMYKWGVALGAEHRAKGANMILGPGLNFNRVARGGRNGEYLTGEDPLFGAVMAENYVKGVQSQKVMATAKHYVFNNQETNREKVNSVVDDRTAHEIYYPAFEAAVDAGAASVLCSYNLVNGTYACGNPTVLNDILRGEWSFPGWVMSDWSATHGVWCEQGLDQDMPGSNIDDGNKDYYNAGNLANVNGNTINTMVYRILLSMITVGSFDSPICQAGGGCNNYLYNTVATNADHVALARSIGSNSAQVLSNNGILPLDTLPDGATIAFVGTACNSDYNLNAMTSTWNLGNYYIVGGSGRVINPHTITILEGVSGRAAALGYKVISDTSGNVDSSVRLLSNATVGIVCGATTSTESLDRAQLVVDQDDFISKVLSQRSSSIPVVVILQTPGPVLTNWRSSASAIVNMFLAGQETGNAWADILFGDVNPSGRLPVTFPDSLADTIEPCSGVQCPYTEGLFVGYRGLVGKNVAFPFGHGLSYTNFTYDWIQPPTTSGCDSSYTACLQVKITNTGKRDGSEVPQLYIDYPSGAGEPVNQLRGFQKVMIPAGSSVAVSFGLTSRQLSIWQGGWKLVNGGFSVYVGASSRDFRLRAQVTI